LQSCGPLPPIAGRVGPSAAQSVGSRRAIRPRHSIPPGAVVVKTSWRDNPALSDELEAEIEHLKVTDPDKYDHVYEGVCRQAVTGAVYKDEPRFLA
jgi:hypothetical protein